MISLLLLGGLPDTVAGARTPAEVRHCEQLERKIRRIHARMRQGYSAKQGVRLEERLRELRRERARKCR